ncbi:MAG: hypothetical protein VSS75_014115 [Candidatus Parabeggiatoa sp.]|nr:hypothetical protein [Candidatus Parabeggiatoa sp.]
MDNNNLVLELLESNPEILKQVKERFFREQNQPQHIVHSLQRELRSSSINFKIEPSFKLTVEKLKREADLSATLELTNSDLYRLLIQWGLSWYDGMSSEEKDGVWRNVRK